MPGADKALKIGIFVAVCVGFLVVCIAVGYLCIKRWRIFRSSPAEYKAASLNNFPEWTLRQGRGASQACTVGLAI
jgi:hypothetical protein